MIKRFESMVLTFNLEASEKEMREIKKLIQRMQKSGSVILSSYAIKEMIYTQITSYSMETIKK